MKKPKQIIMINPKALRKLCQEYTDYINGDLKKVNFNEDQTRDFINCIFETTIEMLYGESFWKWQNQRRFE